MASPGKPIALILGILLGLFILGMALAAILFPAERIIALIEQQASNALDMPVTVEDAGISFAGIPALQVSGITIGPPDGITEPLATVDALKVRVNLLKLLRREVEIVSTEIIRPSIHIIQQPPDTTGTETAVPADGESGPPALPLPVTLSTLTVRDGQVRLDQYPEGTVVLSDIDQRLSLSVDSELTSLTSSGLLTIGDLTLMFPMLSEPVSGLAISFEHDLTGDLSTGSFDLLQGSLTMNGVELLESTGTLRDWSALTVSVTSGEIAADTVLDLIPGSLLPIRDKLTADGTFTFSADAAADLSASTPPTLSGTLALNRMRLAHNDFPRPIDNITARMSFTESSLNIQEAMVETGASSLRIAGSVDSLTGTPAVDMHITGHINMPDFTASLPIPNRESLDGEADVDLTVTGSGTDPAVFVPTGTVGLHRFTFVMPEVLNNPASATGELMLEPDRIILSTLDIRSGESDMQFTGTVDGYRNLLDPARGIPATLTSRLTSSLIDVEDLLVIDKDKEVKVIKPWELKDTVEAMPVPPNLAARLDMSLGSIVIGRLAADSAAGTVTLADGLLSCSDLTMQAYQGILNGTASFDFSAPENPTYATELSLDGFQSGGFLADLFNRGQFMRGVLNTSIALSGAGMDSVSMLDNLTGDGSMQFVNGEIENWEFTRKLGEHLSFLDFDVLAFDTITNSFRIEDRRVFTPDMRVKTEQASLTLDGAAGFDSSIEYDIILALDRETSRRAAESINALTGLIDGDVGELSLTVNAGGTITAPTFSLDTSGAQAQLRERAKQTIQEQVEKLIDERIEDSGLQEEGRKLLDRLLR